MKHPDMIIIARDCWSDIRRRRHFLALEWAKTRRVIYVEPQVPFTRMLSGKEPSFRKVEENIFVFKPVKAAPNSVPGMRALNCFADGVRLASRAARMGFRKPVMWVTAEYGVHYLPMVPHSFSVYDVTDDWPEMESLPPRERNQIISDDKKLLKTAGQVFTVSSVLHKKKKALRPDTILMRNGVKIELYEKLDGKRPEELAGLTKTIVGYAGSLHADRLDVPMICDIASALPEHSFVFVGPDNLTENAHRNMAAAGNINILPPAPFNRLPSIIAGFDICWIPHQVSPFTNSLDPLKGYEYLASGRPILSAPVDGIMPLKDFVTLSSTPSDYINSIRNILAGNETSTMEKRRAAAQQHSWANRAAEIDRIIMEKMK